MTRSFLLEAPWIFFAIAACSGPGGGDETGFVACVTNADCAPGRDCVDGVCAPIHVDFTRAPAYLSGGECAACVTESCAESEVNCGADAACTEHRRCHASCASDPTCHGTCAQIRGFEPGFDQYAALHNCVLERCNDACRVGRDWSCVGNNSWASVPGGPEVEFGINVGLAGDRTNRLAGVTVSVCSHADPICLGPLTGGTTDLAGTARLRVDAVPGGFYGHLRVEDPSSPPRIAPAVIARSPYAPFRDGELLARGLVWPSLMSSYCTLIGGACGPSTVPLAVLARDCQLQSAKDVVLVAPGGAVAFGYLDLSGALDPSAQGPSVGGIAATGAFAVDAGLVEIEVRHAATGTLVAHGQIALQPQTQGSMDTFPETISSADAARAR